MAESKCKRYMGKLVFTGDAARKRGIEGDMVKNRKSRAVNTKWRGKHNDRAMPRSSMEERKSMNSLEHATDEFVAAILESDVYRLYRAELDKVKQVPGLKEQIDEFRKRNYELQASTDNDFEKLERFEKEYENFRENPLVDDFLAAELGFCRMMQYLTAYITAEMKFE